jgi:hypothetical protein
LRASREDQCVGKIDIAGIASESERALREVNLGDQVEHSLGADMACLLLHLLHEPRALDYIRETRIVLDIGRDGELAAWLDALNQDRLQHRARGIDRSRVTGRSRADDDDFGGVDLGHR